MKKTGLIALLLTGCATYGPGSGSGALYYPIIDEKGLEREAVEADLFECQQYAMQAQSTGASALSGALGGAVVGALVGASLGDGELARDTAGVGAVTGAVGSAGYTEIQLRDMVKTCMAGRGYKVLG